MRPIVMRAQVLRRSTPLTANLSRANEANRVSKDNDFFNTVNYKPGDGTGLENGQLYIQMWDRST